MPNTFMSDFAARIRASSNVPNFPELSIGQSRVEVLSGLTVALALVPAAVAFAFVAGVEPLVGL